MGGISHKGQYLANYDAPSPVVKVRFIWPISLFFFLSGGRNVPNCSRLKGRAWADISMAQLTNERLQPANLVSRVCIALYAQFWGKRHFQAP